MFKQFNPMQYLAIDIANHYGLDKKNYEDRIEWVKENINYLEEYEQDADEPILFHKAVNALRKVQSNKPVGHTVALDSASSGLQIMSALMRCKSGAEMTGLIDPDNRVDAYSIITHKMNEKLDNQVKISRKESKEAIMTYLYGSQAVPKRVFPDKELLNCFYETIKENCKGAYELLQILLDSWNSDKDHHAWYMPDGHFVYIPTMVSTISKVELKDWGYTPNVQMRFQKPMKKGLANAANVIHSIDAYILRTMVRRCNYNPRAVKDALIALKSAQTVRKIDYDLDIVKRYAKTKMADITELEMIEKNANKLPKELREKLISILEMVLSHEPFDVVCIHDSFACHPNHCNQLRFHYKEILAELSESTVIDDICNQLYGDESRIKKGTAIAKHIRNSNYAIC